MYRIKQIRPDADPLYLGHPVNRLPVWWHDPKYAKSFLTRQEAETEKRRLRETKGRNIQLHIEKIEV